MIIRVQNPTFLLSPPVLDLLRRGYEKHPMTSLDKALEGLLPVIQDPRVGVFVGLDGGDLKAFSIVFLPTSPLYSTPQIHYVYNEGGIKLIDELGKEVVGYLRRAGYNRAWYVNAVADDKIHSRLFRRFGSIKPAGTLLEITLEQPDGQPVRGQQRRQHELRAVDTGVDDAAGLRGAPVSDR